MVEQDRWKGIRKTRAEKILDRIEAKESVSQRKIETRQKVLLEVMLQEWVRIGEMEQVRVEVGLDCFLFRPQDRKLFGLTILETQGDI